jgi:hypothetical protein
LSHIHRRDFAACVLGQLSVAFHFYHPLVHWLVARLKLEQELSADAFASAVVGNGKIYLTSLAEMALLQDAKLQDTKTAIWPARTFLPTGKTLLRRIDMLQGTNGKTSCKIPPVLKYGAALAIFFAAIVGTGLRGPVIQMPSAIAQAPPATDGGPRLGTPDEVPKLTGDTQATQAKKVRGPYKSLPHSLAYVPRDTPIVASLRPAILLNTTSMAPFAEAMKAVDFVREAFGVDPEEIDQMTVLVMSEEDENIKTLQPAGAVVRLYSLAVAKTFQGSTQVDPKPITYDGQQYYRTTGIAKFFFFEADPTTVVISASEPAMRRMIIAGSRGAESAPWAATWKLLPNDDFVMHWDLQLFRPGFNTGLQVARPTYTPHSNRWSDLTQGASSVALTASLKEGLNLRLLATFSSDQKAREASARLAGTIGWMRQSLSKLRRELSRDPSPEGAIGLRGTSVLDTLIDNRQIGIEQNLVGFMPMASTSGCAMVRYGS